MTITALATPHVVRAAQIRAQIVQREFANKYAPGELLPYLYEHFDVLPRYISNLIDAGHPLSAEYWLLQGERFTGCISYQVLQERVTALGSFVLEG